MKKVLTVLLILIMIFCFVGCDAYNATKDEIVTNSGFVVIEKIGQYGEIESYLVYDPETKVEYKYIIGFSQISICPHYDENGEVVIYKGE